MAAVVQGIIFDLGGVVIDWNPRHLYRKIFAQDHVRMELFLTEICPLEWNERQDAGRSLCEATAERVLKFPEWEREIRAYYGRWTEMIGNEIVGIGDLLTELKQLRLHLYALSNWSLETFPLISDRFSVLSNFEQIFLSGEAKVAKPDTRFYRYALDRIDLSKDQLLFVDDNSRNVEAAQAIGLPSVLFTDVSHLREELRRRGVKDLGIPGA